MNVKVNETVGETIADKLAEIAPNPVDGTNAVLPDEKLPDEEKRIETSYQPVATTNEALNAIAAKLHNDTIAWENEGNTTITAGLAHFVADICYMGTARLRANMEGVEPLRVTLEDGTVKVHELHPNGIKSVTAKGETKSYSYYDQLYSTARYFLGEEYNSNTVKQLLSGACKKAILLAYGYAEIALFARERGNRISQTNQGIPLNDMPNPDKRKYCQAIGVKSKLIRPVEYATDTDRAGTLVRKDATAKPNSDPDVLYYLNAPLTDALYVIKVEGRGESMGEYDAAGWLTRLKPTTRGANPGNTGQGQTPAAAVPGQPLPVSGTPAPLGTPTAEAMGVRVVMAGYTKSGQALCTDGSVEAAVIDRLTAMVDDTKVNVSPAMFRDMSKLAYRTVSRLFEEFSGVSDKGAPDYETLNGWIDVAENILSVVRRTGKESETFQYKKHDTRSIDTAKSWEGSLLINPPKPADAPERTVQPQKVA